MWHCTLKPATTAMIHRWAWVRLRCTALLSSPYTVKRGTKYSSRFLFIDFYSDIIQSVFTVFHLLMYIVSQLHMVNKIITIVTIILSIIVTSFSNLVKTFLEVFSVQLYVSLGACRLPSYDSFKCLRRVLTCCMLHLFSWEYSRSCLPKLGLTYNRRVQHAI